MLFICSTSLLGVEAVTSIFSQSSRNRQKETNIFYGGRIMKIKNTIESPKKFDVEKYIEFLGKELNIGRCSINSGV